MNKSEIYFQPEAVRDADQGAPDEAPGPAEPADPWATMLIRGALSAVVFYSAAHLLIGAFATGTPPHFFALHVAMIALTAAAILLTWTPLYRNHWRAIVFAEASTIAIGALGLSTVGAPPGDFFTQAMMLQIGTAAVVPWGLRWQAGYAAVCAAAAIMAASLMPVHDQFLVYRWLELGAASGLALFVAALLQQHRDAIRRRIDILQASEEQLWKIFDANPDIVTIVSYPEGRHLEVSSNFLKTGYTKAEAIGATARDLHLWADESRLALYEEQLKTRGQVQNLEATFRLKDGTLVTCLVSGAVVRLSRGHCVVSVVRDITRIKRAEGELIAARTAAEATSRAKSEFLSSMSHEIRTPMNAVLGMAEVLADSHLNAEQRKYLSIMINNGNALLELIDDILDLARIESGKLSLERAAFDLADLAERVAETLSIRAHQKKLELVVRIGNRVSSSIVGDALRLRQILVNLIGNAIKFTDKGEIVLGIDLETADDPGLLHFSVADSGIGIAPENISGIFASYAQAEQSTARKYGGTGLGLAIVKRLVDLMGGRIWVESEVGKGSTFHFTLRFDLHSPIVPAESRIFEHLRVLVADGSPAVRSALRELLTNRGAEVSEADSAEKARAMLADATNEFSAVLFDCGLAGINGSDPAADMRAAQRHGVMVIPMLTTEDLSSRLPALRRAGFLNHLIKPIRRAELFAVIKGVFSSHAPAAPADSQHELPSVAPAIESPQPPTQQIAAAQAAVADRPLRILLADDSPDNRLLIEAFVRKVGWTLDKAEDGADALRKFIAGHYDVVLMDIQMPVMDGYTAARRIRQWEIEHNVRRTPIIALTASVLDEAVGNSFEAGCDTHVSKPVRRPTLIAAIREVVSAPADADPPAPFPRQRRTRALDLDRSAVAFAAPPVPGIAD